MSRSLTALRIACLGLLAAALVSSSSQDGAGDEPLLLGSGAHRYRWVRDWAQLPEGRTLGYTHGCVVVDAQDRVYLNTDTEDAVMVFAPDGKLLKTWGAELAGGVHGMTLVKEDGEQFLYLTHLQHSAVYKATLDGEILWKLDWPEESGLYESAAQFHPTSVAVGPGGELFVADGYGKSWIHHYDKDRKYLGSFAGPGSEPGRTRNSHGIFLQPGEPAHLVVADRENRRVQTLDLDGEFVRMFAEGVGRPCHVDVREGAMAVADILGKVTILDWKGDVLADLGTNPVPEHTSRSDLPVAEWRDGLFIAPHCVRWDSKGNLYVVDWQSPGRITKLERMR